MKFKEKKIKTLEDHGKQLVKSSGEKESIHLKQREILEELASWKLRIDEIQNLSQRIDFNNVT